MGRAHELAQADAVLDGAARGRASVLVVTGEAGVGKTTLLDAVVGRAGDRGFAVAVGRCAASEAPPYWPWPRVLGALGATPEVPGGAGAGGRAALFAGAADVLVAASRERPVLVAIDDLQWSDDSSLALTSFLVAAASGLRVALVFAVRDEPADLPPPLRDWLAGLPGDVVYLPLSGLDMTGTAALMRSVLGSAPPPDAVEALHRRTSGNPLFVKECAALLAGRRGTVGAVIPDRVRQLITRRLARVSPDAYDVLAAAAVADDFDPGLLAAISDRATSDVVESLGEAAQSRLVVSDEDGHRFAHALIRETLLDTQSAVSRTELHKRAAAAAEAQLARAGPGEQAVLAGRAAAHWEHVPGEGRPRAARLAVVAARATTGQLAYDHAATLYGWARDLGDDSLETLTELGEAQVLAGQVETGRATLASAAARASAEQRGDALARAVLAAGAGLGGYEVDVRDEHQVGQLREAIGLLGDEDSSLRAAALARLALVDTYLPPDVRAEQAGEAAAMAARLGDDGGEVAALAARCDILSGPEHAGDRMATTARMVALAQRQPDPVMLLVARRHRVLVLLEHGQIGRADDEIAAYARTSDHLRLPLYSWIVPIWRGMRALIDGDLRGAAVACDEAEALGRAAGSANADVLVATLRFAIHRAHGSTAALEAEVDRVLADYVDYPASDGVRGLHFALTDRADDARRVLRRRMGAGIASIPRDSEWLESLWNLGEVAALVGDLEAAEEIHDALVPYADLWAIDGIGAACYGAVSHQLGRLSIALDRRDEARDWLEQAQAAHEANGARHLAAATAALRQSLASPPPRPPKPVAVGALTRDGPVWRVRWQESTVTVRHSKGIVDLARLLERPGAEIHALDLMTPSGAAPDRGGTGPVLDAAARRAYRRRLHELEEELDEASAAADETRRARLELERDALVAEITRAYGLGGRERTAGDPAERARKAVNMRITTAIRAIAARDPDLARHLDHSIVTGRYCSYQPETETRWEVTL